MGCDDAVSSTADYTTHGVGYGSCSTTPSWAHRTMGSEGAVILDYAVRDGEDATLLDRHASCWEDAITPIDEVITLEG